MYYRSQGYRYGKDVSIPINYSGSAFIANESDTYVDNSENDSNIQSDTTETIPQYDSTIIDATAEIENSNTPQTITSEKSQSTTASIFKNLTSNSFLKHIGSEDLLILALIFLLSDTDTDNDIIWLLVLLLFIK